MTVATLEAGHGVPLSQREFVRWEAFARERNRRQKEAEKKNR